MPGVKPVWFRLFVFCSFAANPFRPLPVPTYHCHPAIFGYLPAMTATIASNPTLLAFLYLLSVTAAPAQSLPQPHYSRVTPGLEYAHLLITNQPWSIHIARVQRSR